MASAPSSFDDDYDVRTFSPVLVDGVPDDATRDWVAATRIAFHQSSNADAVRAMALGAVADGRVLTGVYAKNPVEGGLPATWPVGTYTGYTKTINVGGGSLVDSYLISDVTVRPTHKRKGMLRRLMTERLAAAAADGLALAALTASEATIYRRFGFGAGVRKRSITLRRDRPFALHAETSGRVELADPASLSAVARDVFRRFHAHTPGSVDRQEQLWGFRLGTAGDDGKPDESMRAAVHVGDDGVDGYVTYSIKDDGGSAGQTTLTVVDLVGADSNAYLALWAFIGSVDLVDVVVQSGAPVDNPLLYALVDSRSLRADREADHIWLRILDVVRALEARPYSADGTLVLEVHDKLGHADGTWRLTAAGGRGTVVATDDAPDLTVDAATLATFYLGGVSAGVLAEAGLVQSHRDGAVALATALFAPDRPVYSITEF